MTNSEYIRSGLGEIGIEINEKKLNLFLKYLDLLKKWNKKINLTSISNDKDIILKHFIDSLSISSFIKLNKSALDIGSGAGFPGIPLLIQNPTIYLTLIESVQKKAVFLNEVRRSLDLKNLEIICSRAEDPNNGVKTRFDYVLFRAVGKINYLLSIASIYLNSNGKVIIMKSNKVIDEIAEIKNHMFSLDERKELNLPFSNDKRYILVFSLNK
ncbi:MAG: 16S rRNA (guanine(527)-N(7))-methyltransferase RsmG [Thermodesulfobacteriota bacterium]